jgi:hypothetical protein
MDQKRTETRHLRPFVFSEPTAALVAAPLELQTYRNLGYLLLSLPLGVAYFAVLLVGFGLVPGTLSGLSAWLVAGGGPLALVGAVLCVLVGVAALPAMLPVLAAVQRLIGLERRLTGNLLGGSLGRGVDRESAPIRRDPWRRLASSLRDIGLARGMTYLVVKGPLAVVAFMVVAGAVGLIALLLLAPLLATNSTFADLYATADIQSGREAWLCVLVAFPVLGLAVQAVNALAWVTHELARLLLAPTDVARYEWATGSTTR